MNLTALLVLTSVATGLEPTLVQVERTVPIMGTVLRLEFQAAARDQALKASETAVRAVEAAEARLSTWSDGSELSGLNGAATDLEVALSPELARELAEVEACWRATDGAFDPGIGAVLRAWDVRGGGRMPTAETLHRALEASGLDKLGRAEGMAWRNHSGLQLDEGGFGKGAGLDRAAEALHDLESPVRALLDLGGQITVVGAGEPWTVGIADPRDRERTVLRLEIDSGSVATSGNSERGLSIAGERFSHLLDPRTGRPVEDFGSLTVVVERGDRGAWGAYPGLWADCLSTGLYVLGVEKALAWAAQSPGIEVLTLETIGDHLRARATPGIASRWTSIAPDLDLEIHPRPKQP